MSQFVQHLIERHTQPTSPVLPRLRSRFETERPVTLTAPDGDLTGPLIDESGTEPPTRPGHPSADRDSKDLRPDIAARQQMTMTTAQPGRMPNDDQIAWPDQPESVAQPTLSPRVLPTETLPNRTETQLDTTLDVQPHQTGFLDPPATISPDRAAADSIKPSVGNAGTAFDTWPDRPVIKPGFRLDRRDGQDRTRRDLLIPDTAPPAIRITIGRIDVRAVPSASPATAQPRPGPKPLMSLEDYLKQRNNRH